MRSLKLSLAVAGILAMGTMGCVKGPKGDPGAPGVGIYDDNNVGGKIISTINCDGDINAGPGIPFELVGLTVEYNAVLTAGNDVYATANIIDDEFQVSGTAFYASGQSGASKASVLITSDYVGSANGGFWEVSLNRDTLVTSVKYTDSSLGGASPVNMQFNAAACTVQNW